jgi:hypothetical protein
MADPILWAHKSIRTRRIMVDGEQRVERMPQRGHAGNSDYDNPQLISGKRWELFVKHDGHTVRTPLTNGASLVVGGGDDGSCYRYVTRKAKFLGWYALGTCPCALLINDELRPHQIVDKSLLQEDPCKPRTYSIDEPCQHALREQEARQAAHAKRDAQRCKSMQSEVDKLLVAQKEQTKEIVSGLTEAVTAIATAMQNPKSAAKGTKDPAPPGDQK